MKAASLLLFGALLMPVGVSAQNAAFTYQGRLMAGSQPANGLYDFRFQLASDPIKPYFVGPALTNLSTAVSNGLFTVVLDCGAGVFDGTSRWLEITVGNSAGYTTLSPRQPLTLTPYAAFATSAGSAKLADNLQPGATLFLNTAGVTNLGGLNLFLGTNGNYGWLGFSNGMINLPAWNSGTAWAPGIFFYNTNAAVMASLVAWADHGGGPGIPELLIESQRNIALIPGGDGQNYLGHEGEVQLGYSGPNHDELHVQYDDSPWTSDWADGVGSFAGGNNLGHSKRLEFRAHDITGAIAEPAIMGFSGGDSTAPPPYDAVRGTLRFYSVAPQLRASPVEFRDTPGIAMGEMLTDGWNLRGRLVQEHASYTAAATNLVDWHQPVSSTFQAQGNALAFVTTNLPCGLTNNETRVVFIKSGTFSPTLSFPASWHWLSESGTAYAPTNLAPGRILELTLTALGPGDSNVLARARSAAFP
jgi:hypothetical protein